MLGHFQAQPAEDDMLAEALVDLADLDERHGAAQPPLARMRRWSRSTNLSTRRAWGMVTTTKRMATVITGERLKWLLAMIFAWLKASMVPMTFTRAVSFCSPMKS